MTKFCAKMARKCQKSHLQRCSENLSHLKAGTKTLSKDLFRPVLSKLEGSIFLVPAVMLRSLNPVTKDTPIVAMILGRPSPDPGLSSMIELSGGDAGSLLDLARIGKA